ncbi:hypothetical protein MRX96_057004 [Rhipicephalus microplus]
MPRSRFSDEGDSILARLLDPNNAVVPGSAQRPIPTIGVADNGGVRPIPTTEADEDEDTQSSVSKKAKTKQARLVPRGLETWMSNENKEDVYVGFSSGRVIRI